MLAAIEFYLEELSKKKLETVLIKDKASWLKTHFSLVYHSIFINNNFKDLENLCNIVAKYPNINLMLKILHLFKKLPWYLFSNNTTYKWKNPIFENIPSFIYKP
ncbi:hypothetical protein Glove_9g164 [Diversispora epigaea]|uniref:BACK domain-containing protein n=1 Tax=Diversispora epigaea TaxID=1348612 RepID=A0A397JUR7_9GLOM|nr:hypothetical protein Glove_9g164 [Diversispora epigaea]